MRDPRLVVVPGILVLAWLLLSIPYGLTGLDLLAGAAAAAAGAAVVVSWPPAGRRLEIALGRLHELLDLGDAAGRPARGDIRVEEGELDAAGGEALLEQLLEALARDTAADRLVVWEVDVPGDRVRPRWSVGPTPPAGPAAGSPLRWALEERSALRLDPAPRWARGSTVVAPIDGQRILTAEGPPDAPPDPIRVGHAGGVLRTVLTFVDRETDALAARSRLDRVVEFLKALPRERDPGRVPDSLATASLDLLGAEGTLVASWSGESGTVIAREGGAPGPAPGTEFRPREGDLAHAIRLESTVRRGPDDPRAADRPLVGDADPWDRRPPYRVVIPLIEPDGEGRGVVAGWGQHPPSEQGVALIEALAPLLALHLRQASDLARFRERATADPLTGLPNRAALMDRMKDEQARFHRYRRPISLLVLDLDRFKAINDTHGHEAGDLVLRRVAGILRATIRDVDVPARFGGEEMVVVLPETMLRPALEVAERVRAAIHGAWIEHGGAPIPVTASIGVSCCPECVDDPEALFRSADRALYAAKEGGRNRVSAAQRATSGA